MQRKCRYKPLSAQPLVLVLCQVRFSPVPQMDQHIPTIHEVFRRRGFPIDRAGKVHQVTFTPSATTPVQLTERQRWDYRNKDETWSILLTQDTVILQTTAHTRFEDFAERVQLAVHTVLAESEHDRLGVVHRVGLRYIDVVRASGGKDFRFYLRPGLHGVPDEVFQPGQQLLHTESRGRCAFQRCRPPIPASRSEIPGHADHLGGAEVHEGRLREAGFPETSQRLQQ